MVMVDELRTSRWLRPVKSKAQRSQVRGLMCSTSNNNIIRGRALTVLLHVVMPCNLIADSLTRLLCRLACNHPTTPATHVLPQITRHVAPASNQ
ncbi:hypothetical protein HaLaN_24331 [Haematococcus lacustris]|uniref:Uncharacterized protein n=1 Tax=Haematococcus lacustris TaxID=44745 RepID=A0A699ZUW1_HAELA|nr:hypothetical protein HaLaN_24331 [Haematococcus lacustris]